MEQENQVDLQLIVSQLNTQLAQANYNLAVAMATVQQQNIKIQELEGDD